MHGDGGGSREIREEAEQPWSGVHLGEEAVALAGTNTGISGTRT